MADEMANYRPGVTVAITPNVIARFDRAIHVLKE
jgi:hypothetical protein